MRMPAPSPVSGSAPVAPRCSRFVRAIKPVWASSFERTPFMWATNATPHASCSKRGSYSPVAAGASTRGTAVGAGVITITSTKVGVWLVEFGTTLARGKPQHTGTCRNHGKRLRPSRVAAPPGSARGEPWRLVNRGAWSIEAGRVGSLSQWISGGYEHRGEQMRVSR